MPGGAHEHEGAWAIAVPGHHGASPPDPSLVAGAGVAGALLTVIAVLGVWLGGLDLAGLATLWPLGVFAVLVGLLVGCATRIELARRGASGPGGGTGLE